MDQPSFDAVLRFGPDPNLAPLFAQANWNVHSVTKRSSDGSIMGYDVDIASESSFDELIDKCHAWMITNERMLDECCKMVSQSLELDLSVLVDDMSTGITNVRIPHAVVGMLAKLSINLNISLYCLKGI